MNSPETLPETRIEEEVLITLGYEHALDVVIGDNKLVTGRNFLDAYPEDSPHRQSTEDLLIGFRHMDSEDADYDEIRQLLLTYFDAWFGAPKPVESE